MVDHADDDDDFGFHAGGKSRLSSLFPSQATNEEDVNQSLMFVAPKQPKKNEDRQSSGDKGLKLLHVFAGYVFKLENGQFISQGKLGAAILGDHESLNYTLLLYKGKQIQVTRSTINSNFLFSIEPKNYAKFPDDKGIQWSINFSSENQLVDFAKQIALAKANSSGNPPTALIIQDLLASESSTSVGDGDSVDISYTGWVFKNFGFGEVFDESSKSEKPFVVRLGKTNVVKGLSQGLLGAKKSSKRLLVIPSTLGYGNEEYSTTVPPNQPLIFEIFINRIKSSREKSSSPSHKIELDARPEVIPRTHSINEDTIRSRGASISEQLTQSPRKDNAKIISRMAKMGLPMLPMQTTATHTSSESEAERESEHPHSARPPSVKSLPAASTVQSEIHHEDIHRDPRSISIPSPRTTSPHLQSTAVPYSPYPLAALQAEAMPYYHHPAMAPYSSYMAPMVPDVLERHMPLLISESRTQNTEVRLMLAKITDKLDSVIPKIEELKSQQSSSTLQNQTYMEGAILSQNIERIIQENAQMKKDLEIKTLKVQELNEKICDILQRNQRFFEESNSILEQRSDSLQMTTSQLQNKILSLEQEKAKLSSELNDQISNSNKVQCQLNELLTCNAELKKEGDQAKRRVEELNELAGNLQSQHSDTQQLQSGLNENVNSLRAEKETLQSQLKDAKAKLEESTLSEEAVRVKLAAMSEAYDQSEAENLGAQLQAEKELHLQHRKKHETLRENTRAMKDMYEKQMKLLATELKEVRSTSIANHPPQDFSAEIKKAMNVLYKQLQNEVKENQSYGRDEILRLNLDIIRKVTLSYIGGGGQRSRHSSQKSTGSHSSKRSSIDISIPSNNVEAQDSSSKETISSSNPTSESGDQQNATSSVVQDKEDDVPDRDAESVEPIVNNLPSENNIPQLMNNISESSDIQENSGETGPLAENESVASPLLAINPTDVRRSPDHVREEMLHFFPYFAEYRKSVLVVALVVLVCLLLFLGALFDDDMETSAAHSSSL